MKRRPPIIVRGCSENTLLLIIYFNETAQNAQKQKLKPM